MNAIKKNNNQNRISKFTENLNQNYKDKEVKEIETVKEVCCVCQQATRVKF